MQPAAFRGGKKKLDTGLAIAGGVYCFAPLGPELEATLISFGGGSSCASVSSSRLEGGGVESAASRGRLQSAFEGVAVHELG